MGGSSADDGWVIASSAGPRTLVLVGCIGNGKSATGNNILQKRAFASGARSSVVTHTCELHSTVLNDGQILHVMDTPGGSSVDDCWPISSPCGGHRTLVLVGWTGNGKSATGNSILQKREFKSGAKSSGVTRTCEMHTTVLKDGQDLNVIDTPGLFDRAARTEFSLKEIAKCISMAKDGIHAVLVVLSFKTRFTEGEETVVSSLRSLFGSKLTDYIGQDCPEPLKELLHQYCEKRWVLFDNRTPDQKKNDLQVQKLLSLVDHVVAKNSGKPYTDELFMELKKGDTKLNNETEQVTKQENEENLIKRITEMVESKFRESTARLEQKLEEEKARLEQKLAEEKARLEQQLVQEKAARLSAKKMAQTAQVKSMDEINKMRENPERAERELREQAGRLNCAIL